MRRRFEQYATVLALYALALHVILLGFAPPGAHVVPADPFSVICHSAGTADDAPADPGLAPGQACDHCNLCSTAALPPPPDIALGALMPTRVPQALHPFTAPARADVASDPKRARGPPFVA